jgi:hypothetical protein
MDVVAAAGRLWRRLSLRAMFMLGVGIWCECECEEVKVKQDF